MKIFGSIFPFVETDDETYRLGRFVANFEFLKALIEFGAFDEYHLFCMGIGHRELTARKLKDAGLPAAAVNRVRLMLYTGLTQAIAATEYRVFHLGGWGYFMAGLAHLRARHARNQWPITGQIHSLSGTETPYHAFKLCFAPLHPWDTIVCSSDAGRQVMRTVIDRVMTALPPGTAGYRGGMEIIPLGVPDGAFEPTDRQKARQDLGIDDGAFVVLSIARLSTATKMDYAPVCRMFAGLAGRNPGRQLLLILAGGGTAADERELRVIARSACVEGQVRIVRNFDAPAKNALLGAADLFLSLSDNLQETFGIGVVEAMAAGLPVVVSDINGYKELVDDGVEGYKAPVVWTGNLPIAELADIMDFKTMQLYLSQCMAVDTASAADSIQRCIDDPASAATMGERGKRRADARYRWSVVIGEYERLWERLYEQSCHEPARADAPAANLFMHDYLHAFSHYPTRILDENDTVTAALQGPGVSAGSGLPPLFEELTALVGRKQVLEIQAMLAGGPATVAQIAGRLKKAGIEPQNVQMTLLWMAKYGLVRITE